MAIASLLGTWPDAAAPPLLLIVREQVRPGQFVLYDRTESEIRRACERWGCPNAYIALTAAASPREVWWLTAWSSQQELDRAGTLYAGNPALAARLAPLNARKRVLTEAPTTVLARAAGEAPFTLAGARFVTVTPVARGVRAGGALYDLPDGRRIALEPSAASRPRPAPGGMLLAVQPRWSLPPDAFVSADPAFWARRPRPR